MKITEIEIQSEGNDCERCHRVSFLYYVKLEVFKDFVLDLYLCRECFSMLARYISLENAVLGRK